MIAEHLTSLVHSVLAEALKPLPEDEQHADEPRTVISLLQRERVLEIRERRRSMRARGLEAIVELKGLIVDVQDLHRVTEPRSMGAVKRSKSFVDIQLLDLPNEALPTSADKSGGVRLRRARSHDAPRPAALLLDRDVEQTRRQRALSFNPRKYNTMKEFRDTARSPDIPDSL